MIRGKTLCRIACLSVAVVAAVAATSVCAEDVSFTRDIQPILAKRCFACHGPAEQEAGIALHTHRSAIHKSESGKFAIVPGNSAASELLKRVTNDDESKRMPPEGPRLSKSEVELLRKWIQQGAKYELHWAFVAPVRPVIPRVAHQQFVRNEIDTFVLVQLEDKSLGPSPEAGREALIRRLSIDLTGLLPALAEVEAFRQDDSEHAYEQLVDRMLASQHFGERWGRHWLDLARYADSFGYERDDVRPNAWRYRDWVINSINGNQPFDQFVIDQLAGDLYDKPSIDNLIATGLHRMNIKNNESGINREDYRNREMVDRVNTTGTAFLGLTIGCCQCHSHKYDPLSQKEFYQFYAFFNNVEEKDVDIKGAPAERVRYESALSAYKARKQRLESRKQLLQALQKHVTPAAWTNSVTKHNGVLREHSQRIRSAAAKEPEHWFEGFADKNLGPFDFPKVVATALSVASEKRTEKHTATLRKHHAGLAAQATRIEGRIVSPRKQLQVLNVKATTIDALLAAAAERSKLEQRHVDVLWSSRLPRYDDTLKAIRQLSVQQRHLPKPYVMTLAEAKKKRRDTFTLERGDFKRKGEQVFAATPAVLSPFKPRSKTGDRLDLARWIVDAKNPLTARVAVNHFWKHLFGTGLVATPDDFGTQGDRPSHPQLVDWLAVRFMESGWDRKQLIRTIVTSATYRQVSRSRPALDAVDPQNRLLGRQSRFRVESEIVRDLFLDAAGLLHRDIGGPTIHPEISEAVSDLGYKYKTRWVVSDKPQRYRRGMYIHFKRTNPYPSLVMFDSPESNLCIARRNRSNTPLQALTTLNDPVFVECARSLGRLAVQRKGDDTSKIQFVVGKCLSRTFNNHELDAVQRLLDSERKWYADRPDQAVTFVSEASVPEIANHRTAGWIAVARAILNLDEFVTRE